MSASSIREMKASNFKRVSAVLCIVALSAGFGACGNKAPNGSQSASAANQATTHEHGGQAHSHAAGEAPHEHPVAADPGHGQPGHGETAPAAAGDSYEASPSVTLADGARLFGAALAADRAVTSLRDLTADPARYSEQIVKTEGTINRVCQAMGCWMELRADGVADAVRIPMAAHAYFLPQDVTGKQARIEGRVSTRPLSEVHKRHLESEGATATRVALAIEATGVEVR